MKKLILSILVIAAFVVAPVSVFGQSAVSASVSGVPASSRIITPITITQTAGTQLNFGTMTTPEAATVVSISTSAVRAVESGATTLVTTGGVNTTPSVPEFTVTGEKNASYAITLPSTDVILTSGVNTMKVNVFNENASKTLTTGTETFKVGARLNLTSGQPSGTYTGVFGVTVAYN